MNIKRPNLKIDDLFSFAQIEVGKPYTLTCDAEGRYVEPANQTLVVKMTGYAGPFLVNLTNNHVSKGEDVSNKTRFRAAILSMVLEN